jgi:hypothetical protein
MIMRLILLAALLFSTAAEAQTVNVILSGDTTKVLGAVPSGPTYNPSATTINTSDARWTAYLANLAAQQALAAYQGAYQTQLALGIVLTSTGTPALNDSYPLDDLTQGNLQGIYSGIVGATFITGSISGPTLTVGSTQSGAVAANQFLSGTGVTAGTQIASGSGSTWTVNNSQAVSSEAMIVGGLGTGFPGGQSTVPLANLAHNTTHNFGPVDFMNYRNAVVNYLLQCSYQVYVTNGNTFPSNAVTIP